MSYIFAIFHNFILFIIVSTLKQGRGYKLRQYFPKLYYGAKETPDVHGPTILGWKWQLQFYLKYEVCNSINLKY